MVCIDDAVFIHVEIKGMVRLQRIVRVAVLGFLPPDDLARVFDQHFAFGDILHREHALAVHARAPHLDAAAALAAEGSAAGVAVRGMAKLC